MSLQRTESDDTVTADLAELLPVPAERDVPLGRAVLMRSTLTRAFQEAAADNGGKLPTPRHRKPVWRIGVPIAVFAAVGATAAAMFIDDSPARVSHPAQTSCSYEYTKTPKFLYGVFVGPAQTPEEACLGVWGAMTETARTYLPAGSPERTAPHTAPPPLVACAAKSEAHDLWVMPKPDGRTPKDACTALGMTLPDNEARYGGATVEQVRRLGGLLNGPGLGSTRCMTIGDARARAERALAEVGVTNWPVKAGLEPNEDPNLAFPVVVPEETTIYLRNGGMTQHCAENPTGR
ncbi:hypothetical protein [Embleya sp. NBC_00896]|uniref:hypothetical protein n=1 Tax=Embleya sp. NBC_00896 TaxID=2975961 RepID=UPI002F919DB0|nr:hypothetical protein OG928_39690 [Embleya sp. NBC_00896]